MLYPKIRLRADVSINDLIKVNFKLAYLYLNNKKVLLSDFLKSYESLAFKYDEEWYTYIDLVTSEIVENLKGISPKMVLDLGCGTGATTLKLKNLFPEAHFTALDFSRSMLRQARKKLGNENAFLLRDDMEKGVKKFLDNQFDLIVVSWSPISVQNPMFYEELSRILSPDGHILILTSKEDSLKQIKAAIDHTMKKYPENVEKIIDHKYPKDKSQLLKLLGNNLKELNYGEGSFSVSFVSKPSVFNWLINTSLIAGYENVLDLKNNDECKRAFENYLKTNYNEIVYSYMWLFAQKK